MPKSNGPNDQLPQTQNDSFLMALRSFSLKNEVTLAWALAVIEFHDLQYQ